MQTAYKLIIICATALAAVCASNAQTPRDNETADIRILSYNVHNGRGLDKITDYKRIGDVISKRRPDFVAIQETDSATNRSNNTYVLGEIGKWSGLHPVFGPAISYEGGKYGIGILSREEPISTRQISLPGREESRTLLIAEFEDCVFACTHLSLNKEDRLASAGIITEAASQYDKPFFIAGDWNAKPGSEFITAMSEYFDILNDTSAMTFPANKPDRCIDYIACYKGAKGCPGTITAEVIDEPEASDHRPVFVVIGSFGTTVK